MSRPRTCRVCGCTDDNACVIDGIACHWLAQEYPGDDICSACEDARGHVVTMTMDRDDAGASERVGTCSCGFVTRAPFRVAGEAHSKIDSAVVHHWRIVAGRTDLVSGART